MTPEEEHAHLTAPSSDPKQRMIDYWGRLAEKAEAEVERLRAQLAEDCAEHNRMVENWGKERERLRAALQELAGDAYHDDDYQVIARRALERK